MNKRKFVFSAVLSVFLVLALSAPAPQPMQSIIAPAFSDIQFISAGTTPPTEAQCFSVGRRCFTPQAIRASYNINPLYAGGFDGHGMTIAVIDSYGSDTMPHDLHVFDQAFGLPPMCGEEGVTCAPGMPTFSVLHVQGAPATNAPPPTSNGTGIEDKSAWALEVALDVEMAHAIAPGANILLVTTPTAETLGVQGFAQMMNAIQYVADHHLAQVISMSLAAGEPTFKGGTAALMQLRQAFVAARDAGITVLGATGDSGTANSYFQPVGKGGSTIPYPSVEWPASDPLVTAVGGTYLCTDPFNTTTRVADSTHPPVNCINNPGQAEVGWVASGGGFSQIFAKPDYQNVLPAGSTPIGNMRGIPDVGFQASARTGALVYISLPPDGNSGLFCGSTPCSTGWYDIGGTSLSTPQWAGLVAIADQINGGGLGLINPGLYKIGADPARYSADFYDVTVGNNQADPSIPGYPATIGWDPVTGLGTPNAAHLMPDLVAAVHGH